MRSLSVGDTTEAERLLRAQPDLASARLTRGGERGGSPSFFLEEIRYQMYAGHTALHVAAAAYNVDFATQLVAAGAAVDAANEQDAIVRLLRAAGAR
jgi:hypothetical protein